MIPEFIWLACGLEHLIDGPEAFAENESPRTTDQNDDAQPNEKEIPIVTKEDDSHE